ncbi:hypothetical protein M2267_003087 [Ensifer sp. KUDG1]
MSAEPSRRNYLLYDHQDGVCAVGALPDGEEHMRAYPQDVRATIFNSV